mmetsp:Transcript_19389/g.23272  ORF Transcript_19389/g.23272 Transcript_19389/m.23272 type:complete len:214 (-) Transcript_19389:229-870(-)|eukprot:CAMPEP_0195252468 /NCGR_PEP_ID=MMETSP0706-20130129/3879_1 /TAXON_ID=33640 /ORGANISM="Asterionellopsis glacialis, Strain CCMP134" /LENGTH=213 /DNA_ID=CAMNT_0040304767 /DNA_START=105 /DNA_END=746 /DNA_ORIENTATION=-
MGSCGSKSVSVQNNDWDKNIPLEKQLWPDERTLFDKRPDTGVTAEHPTVADADEPKPGDKTAETRGGMIPKHEEKKMVDTSEEDPEWQNVNIRAPQTTKTAERNQGVGASMVGSKAQTTEVARGDDLKMMDPGTPDHLNNTITKSVPSSKPKPRQDSAFPTNLAPGGFAGGARGPLPSLSEVANENSASIPKKAQSRRESHGLAQPGLRPPTR